jgi:hypothetical protein
MKVVAIIIECEVTVRSNQPVEKSRIHAQRLLQPAEVRIGPSDKLYPQETILGCPGQSPGSDVDLPVPTLGVVEESFDQRTPP